MGYNKDTKSPTNVQQNFLRWYIIIRYNAFFISKSNKISVNPQIPEERFGNNRNAFFLEAHNLLFKFGNEEAVKPMACGTNLMLSLPV